MANNLKEYFPIIRTKEEILDEIGRSPKLSGMFLSWKPEYRRGFLNFCTGVKGIKLLYDSFFKEIFNPEYDHERLDDLLSCLLGQRVTVVHHRPV